MSRKKIDIIGVGGRTGTMFAFELSKKLKDYEVGGIGENLELIKNKKLYIERNGFTELFTGNTRSSKEFLNEPLPDFIFLTVKNPVAPIVKYYYQQIKQKGGKVPAIFISQNGIVAGEEALSALKEIFGEEANKIQIIRISLFNSIEKEEKSNNVYIKYSLPINLSFGVFSGPQDTKEIKEIFKNAEFLAEEVSSKNVKNMEYSKLLVNLIGIPSAIKNLSIEEGFEKPEVFKEEIGALREYIKIVKALNGKFLNFKKIPTNLLVSLISLPLPIISFFRKKLSKLISKGRSGRPKGNLDEIDYYNGAVVKLGQKVGIPTPINNKILKEAKNIL